MTSFGLKPWSVPNAVMESEAQRTFLDLHGCHAFQGVLFSKPVPIEEFEMLLKQD
jgi:EAL domain-containing protein (putative c-di-GMP-specific phosphodiesterase class I)